MKIPDWAKSASVSDEIRMQVLRVMTRNAKNAKPSSIVHCLCGSGCKKCFGEPHCGCKRCYRPEKKPRPLSTGDLETLTVSQESSETFLSVLPPPCTAEQIRHCSRKLRAEDTSPVAKYCKFIKAQNPVKQTQYFCRKCSLDLCNSCFLFTCSSHNVLFLGSSHFVCQSVKHSTVLN